MFAAFFLEIELFSYVLNILKPKSLKIFSFYLNIVEIFIWENNSADTLIETADKQINYL